jgi:hypothetical protein
MDSAGTDSIGHGDREVARDLSRSARPDLGKVVLAVNGVIASVGGAYASTHSLAVTVVAGCAGLGCAALFAWQK